MRSAGLRQVRSALRQRSTRRVSLAVGLAAASAAGAFVAVTAPTAWSGRARGPSLALAVSGTAARTGGSAGGAAATPGPGGRYNTGAAHSPELLRMLTGRPALAARAPRVAGRAVTYVRGIDVSSQQHAGGAGIGWARVAGAGYKFAFVKATEGSYFVNPFYAGDVAGARRAGLLTAAYAFAIPNDSGPALQADLALNAAGDLSAGGRTLPLVVDLEYDPYVSLDHTDYCYGLTNAAMVAWITAFITEVQRRTGAPPVIYTIAPWWHLCTGDSTAFGADPLWIASGGTTPKLPAGWTQWQYWQYTAKATVPGVAGKTDVSYFSAATPDAAAPPAQSDAAGSAATLTVRALNAAAGQPLTWAAAGLPAGVAIGPNTGKITGTLPATPASYPVTLTVTDAASHAQTLRFTWQVHGPARLTWPGRQSTAAGGPVGLQIHAKDGLAGCSLAFTAAGLPPGLAISPCGRITGWATRPGQYQVTIRAAGSAGRAVSSTTFPWTTRPPLPLATGRLRLAIASLCLAVPAGLTARTWTCGKSAGQTFQVTQNGTIQISGHCLAELSPASTTPVLRPCTSLLGQIWQQTQAGALANAQSGRCLTDPGASRKDGTALTLTGCDGTQRQAWTLPPAPLATGLGQCIHVTSASGGNPASLTLVRCATTRQARQGWTIAPDGTISASGGPVSASTVPAGCLTTTGITATAGTPITLTPCPAAATRHFPAQQWQPMPRLGGPSGPGGPASTGSFLINPATGLCLAVAPQPPAGTPLTLGYCLAGYPSLTWHLG